MSRRANPLVTIRNWIADARKEIHCATPKPSPQPNIKFPDTNMSIEGMTVENNPTLKRTRAVDWARIAYWAIKFFSLAAMLTALVLLFYGTWLGVAWLIMGVIDGVAWSVANFAAVKRGFYTIVFAALFFYAVRAVRAAAKYWEQKAETLKAETLKTDGGES